VIPSAAYDGNALRRLGYRVIEFRIENAITVVIGKQIDTRSIIVGTGAEDPVTGRDILIGRKLLCRCDRQSPGFHRSFLLYIESLYSVYISYQYYYTAQLLFVNPVSGIYLQFPSEEFKPLP
jgi:hypothetical protein